MGEEMKIFKKKLYLVTFFQLSFIIIVDVINDIESLTLFISGVSSTKTLMTCFQSVLNNTHTHPINFKLEQ